MGEVESPENVKAILAVQESEDKLRDLLIRTVHLACDIAASEEHRPGSIESWVELSDHT
jgi:hypothetical protein